jgi:hypothetical protein
VTEQEQPIQSSELSVETASSATAETPLTNSSDSEALSPAIIFRALKASVIIIAFFVLFAWGAMGSKWALDFAFFSMWSVANLFCLSKGLLGVMLRHSKVLILLRFACIPLLIAILLLFFAKMSPRLSAFWCGFHLPMTVVILKVVGWHLSHKSCADKVR